MASFTKLGCFAPNQAQGVHDLSTAGSQLMVCLSNVVPDTLLDTVLADITQISYTNVVETYPADTLNVGAEVPAGNWKVTGTDLTVTASGGAVAGFRYAILYDATPTTPLSPLIGYWDYGATVILADTEVFNIPFGSAILNFS